jgi:hypothetical protein
MVVGLQCAFGFIVLTVVAVASSLGMDAASRDVSVGGIDTSAAAHQEKNGSTRVYYGIGSCASCHTKGFEDPHANICRGNEVGFWQAEDKHGLAFKVLTDERAKRMGEILWKNADVTGKKECLTCHSAWFDEQQHGVERGSNFKREDGVSCVACHGADIIVKKELKPGWVDAHGFQNPALRETWRKLSRADKDEQRGMTDLWDPARRTQLCASCHIGNVAQGKVVTHEMYAAGHPPLPSFEVVTFSNQMPRHWQYLREKDEKIRALVLNFRPGEVDLEQVHLLAIGGLVAFGENLRLLAEQKDWPELANYSCYACHHELKSKSWRQERGYNGTPGRPPMREWSTALVELGLFHAARDKEELKQLLAGFQGRLATLQSVIDAQPFGRQDSVKQKAEYLIQWIDAQVKLIQDRIQLDDKPGGYSQAAASELLAYLLDLDRRSHPDVKLASALKRMAPDYDSARQFAWAYQVLYLETASKFDPEARKNLTQKMHQSDAWKELDKYMRLSLPQGKLALEPSVQPALERISQYEPRLYFQHFDAVLKQFKMP